MFLRYKAQNIDSINYPPFPPYICTYSSFQQGHNASSQKRSTTEKSGLHPRNKHRERYDFKQLIASCPALEPFVKLNEYEDESVDFFDPKAVKMLNKALLKHHYGIDHWDIPQHYLCPPIPGRADYIHHVADLLADNQPEMHRHQIPTGPRVKCLEIGVGASCVYPIIGHQEYGWSFVGTDIDPVSIQSSNKIIENNPFLKGKIELKLQTHSKDIFQGIIRKDDRFDLTICNPPFHASLAEAKAGTVRKLRNLGSQKMDKPILNFGGQNHELWCEGGEEQFVENMIAQSQQFAGNCFWFTTLISKQTNLKNAYKALKKVKALDVKTIEMSQGNKSSRVVAWTFFTPQQREIWVKVRWNEGI